MGVSNKITRNDAVDFVEEKQVAFEILEFCIHQSCSVIYSIIDGRLKKINNNQAFELLESVKVSKNLIC